MVRCKQCKTPLGIVANYQGVKSFTKFKPNKDRPWQAEVELGPGTTYITLSVRCSKCKVRWIEGGARLAGDNLLVLPAGFVNSKFIEFVYEGKELEIVPVHELLERPKDERGHATSKVAG
jgi:hypothetical protein